jgi:DNA-directed RNA polymerase subunit beta'
MKKNFHIRFFEGGYFLPYLNLFIPRPIVKKPVLLKIDSIFNYDDQSWQESLPNFFSTKNFEIFKDREMLTGGDAIYQKLTELNLEKIAFESYNDWVTLQKEEFTGNIYEDRKIKRIKDLLIRRVRIAKYFLQSNVKPEWMVLSILPVLPPELRPMLELQQGELITSDLNELYRKVIYRNNSLIGFLKRSNSTPLGVILNQKRLVQEAVDALIDNRIGNHIMKDRNHRPYKSFSEMIEGKEGRFRQDLLGKRVDYSGRSVIVVGPSLSLHQCGLPREMAIILFQPFLIRGLIIRKLARNFIAAKKMIKSQDPIIWSILEESIKNHPILLNRAPTLHRLGIQAFQPILTKESAIQLHPLVCSGFNADFDGDQMAVHVPLSLEAQAEARLLMLAHGNLISPATGEAVAVPSQDMLLGLYLLTMQNRKGIYNYFDNKNLSKIPYFSNYNNVIQLKDQGKIFINDSLWLKCTKYLNSTTIGEEHPLEIQFDSFGMQYKIYDNWQIYENQFNKIKSIYLLTTTGRVIFNQQLNEAIQVFV